MKLNSKVFILFLILFITSCGGDKQKLEVVATVNDAPILLKEFQKEISIQSRRDPTFKITSQTLENHLDTTIEKKLMIQEAMKMGLSEREQFVETIKTFWEQTLIRELIDVKSKEWADRIFVTEDEIQKQYQRMQYAPTLKVVRTEEKDKAEDVRERMLKGEQITGEETIGPLFSENDDVSHHILHNAFEISVGEVRIFEDKKGYIVIYVINKDKTPVPPLKDIHSQVKALLLERKKQKAMEDWFDGVKKSAIIEINTPLLKKIVHE